MQHNPSRDGLARHSGQAIMSAARMAPKKSGMGGGTALGIRLGSMWKPPHNIPTKFRFLPSKGTDLDGNPQPYYQFVEHWVQRSNRGLLCSKKWTTDENGYLKAIGGKCLACAEVDKGATDIGTRIVYAFEGIHMGYYHLIHAKDKEGKLLFSEYNGEKKPRMEKVPCQGRGCEFCKHGKEKVLGKRVIWSLGKNFVALIGGFIGDLERRCKNCGGDLEVVAFGCPDCGEPLATLDDSPMTDEDIVAFNSTLHECHACKAVNYPDRYYQCNGCKNGDPADLYDVELEVKRVGEGTSTQLMFSNPVSKPLSDTWTKELDKVWDLAQIFNADGFEYQAKVLRITNPYTEGEEGKKEQHEEYEPAPF